MQNIIKYSSYIVVMFFLACFLTGCSSEQKIQAISKDLDDLKKSIKEISGHGPIN